MDRGADWGVLLGKMPSLRILVSRRLGLARNTFAHLASTVSDLDTRELVVLPRGPSLKSSKFMAGWAEKRGQMA